MNPRRYFVTGTDTAVGKTLVTAALLLNAREFGLRAVGVKPVSAGCTRVDGQLVNDDALLLQRHASVTLDYGRVNPVALEPAIAPHIAASRAGVVLDAAALAAHVNGVDAEGHDVVLVEGAGGWLVPLNGHESMADLATWLGYPVILVVAMRLGCLNHALLTAAAIERAGLPLAGWVANSTGPAMDAFDENLLTLEERLPALRLGTVPYLGPSATPEQANSWLDGTSLFGAR
ncbi:MAG: dethiobiotin synthase [Gammaproteobacteria bacterium]|nr:dethiobiotin synthase [Gammaproteobacteria bacterium]